MGFAFLFTKLLAVVMASGWALSAFAGSCIRDGLDATPRRWERAATEPGTPEGKAVRRYEEKLARFEEQREKREMRAMREKLLQQRRSKSAKAALKRAKSGGKLDDDEFALLKEAEAYFKAKGMNEEASQLTERLRPDRQRRARASTEAEKRRARTIETTTIPDEVILAPRAEHALAELDADGSLAQHAKASRSTIHQLVQDPAYPSLKSKKLGVGYDRYGGVDNSAGDVWQSYVGNGGSSAYRIYWRYRPEDKKLIILNIMPHP